MHMPIKRITATGRPFRVADSSLFGCTSGVIYETKHAGFHRDQFRFQPAPRSRRTIIAFGQPKDIAGSMSTGYALVSPRRGSYDTPATVPTRKKWSWLKAYGLTTSSPALWPGSSRTTLARICRRFDWQVLPGTFGLTQNILANAPLRILTGLLRLRKTPVSS